MTFPAVPVTPVLATVRRVELGEVGRWDISTQDGWEPTPDDFASAVAALDCPAVRRPVIKFGHTGMSGEGDPAIGYIDNMAVTDDGQVLVGDYAGIPAWLAEVNANGDSVLASSYPDRSGEWEHDYVCQLGHTHPFVLHAMAILGVMRPGIGTLESLHDLYSHAPQLEEAPMPMVLTRSPGAQGASHLVESASSVTTDDVRRAYYDGPAASDWNLYIREMYLDPPELIVQDDSSDSLIRVPYVISSKGLVTFGDPQPVKVQYVNARTASTPPVVAFASHAESRPQAATIPSAEPVEVSPNREDGTMPTLNEGIRQRLGITDAALTDDALLTALDEALAERADSAREPDPAPVDTPVAPVGEAPEAPASWPVAASTRLPDGVVTVEASVLDQLRHDAARGAEARSVQERQDRAALVAAAISDGRVAPARREHWLKALEVDPGAGVALASLAPGLIPVSEMGHGQSESAPVYAWPGDPAPTKES